MEKEGPGPKSLAPALAGGGCLFTVILFIIAVVSIGFGGAVVLAIVALLGVAYAVNLVS